MSKREKLTEKKDTARCTITLGLKEETKVTRATLRTHPGSNLLKTLEINLSVFTWRLERILITVA